MNLNDVLKRQIEIQPNKTFLFFKDDEISYSTFGKRVNRVASALKKEGVKKDELRKLWEEPGEFYFDRRRTE